VADILDAIEAGDHDDELAAIVNACQQRAAVAGRSQFWRITIDGETWDEDTILLEEMEFVERLVGMDWPASPLVSAVVAKAFILAHWIKVNGMDLETAHAKVGALTAKQVIAAVSMYDAGPVGKDQAASES